MTTLGQLSLCEEIMLLALSNQKGTVRVTFLEQGVAGAILAELLLAGRIALDSKKNKFVELRDRTPTGDPIVDEGLARIASAKRRAALQTWVMRLAGIKKLRHQAARQLCRRGILRADENKIAFIFTRKVYPEIDPRPEREIVERMRAAVLSDRVDPRTVTLIALADGLGVLGATIGKREAKDHKKRIKQIIQGDPTGKATKDAIEACRTAAMVAVMAGSTG